MKNLFFKLLSFFLIILPACGTLQKNKDISGFWEGPHPEDGHKKFYINVYEENNQLWAQGFWTEHNYYRSKFDVDSLWFLNDSIRFYVPAWNCIYFGKLAGAETIDGGFSCPAEEFDPVSLRRKDTIAKYLTEAKPGCHSERYRYAYTPPEPAQDRIKTASFRRESDSVFVYSIIPEIIQGSYGRINSFLMIKDDELICEEYFYGYHRKVLHPIESSTKSIASLIVGIAKDRGLIGDLHEPLHEIFPEFDHLKRGDFKNLTMEHLLTMTSGYDTENDRTFQSNNRIDFALNRPLVKHPGRYFNYDGGNTEILGAVIKIKTGDFADEFAADYLFQPLGIDQYNWDILKQDGFPCMGGSLKLLPRHMAKIGLMVLNQGQFEKEQVISKPWIDESTRARIKTHIEGDDYGYHWWHIHLHSNSSDYGCIWANGLGSQFIYIIPAINVVIVTTGHNYEYDSWAITKGISKYLHLLDTSKSIF